MVVLYKSIDLGYKICYEAFEKEGYIMVVEPHSLSRFDGTYVQYPASEVTVLEERPVMLILREVHGAKIIRRDHAERWEEIIGYEVRK